MTESTNVVNPVKEVASLLAGDAEQQKKKPLEAVEEQEETLEVKDESQPQDESLAEEEVEESTESLDEEGNIDTINNLAEELDIEIEDMYALNVKLSRGENLPEGGAKTLGELKTFYEKNADIESLREGIKNRETELLSQSETVSAAPQVSNELMQARAQVLAIQDSYNNTDWQGLRHSNPAEYAALQSDYRMRFETAKAHETEVTGTAETHMMETRRQQQERLFEALPELKDEKVRAQVGADVQAFAGKYGFTPKDLDKVEDSRLMRLLIEASRSDKAKFTAKDKKVEQIPTASKTSASRPIPGRKAALKRLTEKAKASGDNRDKTKAVAALIGSN